MEHKVNYTVISISRRLFCGETHTSLSILIREISKAAKLLAAASTKIANILWNIDDTKRKRKKRNKKENQNTQKQLKPNLYFNGLF